MNYYQAMRPIHEIRRDAEEALATKRITRRQLTRDTGLSHNTVRRFLNDDGPVLRGTVIRLATYLDVPWQAQEETAGR